MKPHERGIDVASLPHGMLTITNLVSEGWAVPLGDFTPFSSLAFASETADIPTNEAKLISTAVATYSALQSLQQVPAAIEGDRSMMDALIPFAIAFFGMAYTTTHLWRLLGRLL